MISLGVVYLVTSLALVIAAIVIHIKSSSLDLPISPALSIITIILPILAFLNAAAHPRLLRYSGSSERIRQLAPFVTQTLQALATTILATLLFEVVVPSQGLSCMLENEWMSRFRAHDGSAIRRIQDALDCCGFNSVKDRAYPFPRGAPSTCAETYGRTAACRGRWMSAAQSHAGGGLAIVLVVGFLQVLGLLRMNGRHTWWPASTQRGQRLLEGHNQGDDPEAQEPQRRQYGTLVEDDEGPRIVPSGIRERNEWED